MDTLKAGINELEEKLQTAYSKLALEEKSKELSELNKKMAQPDFWSNSSQAQRSSKRQADLNKQIGPWEKLKNDLFELKELAGMDDDSLAGDIEKQLGKLKKKYLQLEKDLRFDGPYDDHDAVLTFQAGAGGIDAQDWAEMLRRMYFRWAEKSGYKTRLIDESKGDEAGIKSSTVMFSGANAYGKLRNEHGVHRLVRLSPFNSGNTRETSFAMVEVLPQIDEPSEVEIDENDIRVDVFRAGGHGGQSVNTTDSAVRITHEPTGIVVSIQNEKSQIQNKEIAMKILRSRLAQLQLEQQKEKISELKGPNKEAAWGNQIRNYVLHPYSFVKDQRSGFETSDVDNVLDGELDPVIEAGLSLS